jgi:hypothetical protein
MAVIAAPAPAQDLGRRLRSIFGFEESPPPAVSPQAVEDVHCPPVGIIESGTAIRAYSGARVGDPAALRHQISIGQTARECVEEPDGSVLVKVGVEGRVLLGPAGAPGRFDTPVTVQIKRGERILASRTQRVTVSVSQGETQGMFVVVQDGLRVPPGSGDYDIQVGLIAGSGGERPARGAKRS